MTGVVKILSLLPIFHGDYEEVKLITQLNLFFNFDYNIYLLDASADKDRYITGQHTPQSLYVFNVDGNITSLEKVTKIKSKNTFTMVVPGSAKFDENLKLLTKLKKIKIQIDMKIGIFMNSPSNEDLENIFKWCKDNLIVNIFAATYNQYEVTQRARDKLTLNIFTFNPFGPFDVVNVTEGSTYERFFPSLKSNFQQHQLLILDGPYGRYSDGQVWRNVLQRMNATYRLVWSNLTDADELIETGIDFLPLQYVQMNGRVVVYPLIVEPQVMIVPVALPYPEFSAYLRTLTSDKFFGYSLFTTVAVMLLLCFIRYIKQKEILFFQSVADVLNLLANDNGYIKYQRLSRAEVCLIVPLTFVGFLIVNGILSNLQSYITRPVIQPQINTAEDLYRSAVDITTNNDAWRETIVDRLTSLAAHKDWGDKIVITELLELEKQIKRFNRSISAVLQLSDAKVLLEVQKRLNIKGYHISGIQTSFFPYTHVLHDKFLFFKRFDEILHRMQSAGIYIKWRRNDSIQYANETLNENIETLKDHKGNFENEILTLPIFIVYGWIAGVIVLLIEIIWKKLNSTRMKKFKRIFAKNISY